MPLFWKLGFADTGLQDLEKATGVNKSGLYSEFKDKEEIFIESLRHYQARFHIKDTLLAEPLGLHNIENFFKSLTPGCTTDQKGCFGINSFRELGQLPEEAHEIVADGKAQLKKLFAKNIAAGKTKMAPEALAEVVSTFFSGFCIEQNLNPSKASLQRKIEDLMRLLRGA